MPNLEETTPGSGVFKCRQGCECKSSGTGGGSSGQRSDHVGLTSAELAAQGHAIIHPTEPEICHAHRKKRSPQQLFQVMTVSSGPQWECLPEARCKVSPDNSNVQLQLAQQLAQQQLLQRFTPYAGLGG
eukprot:Sspe_Gene.117319::Locus_108418_Transcript_1_1_Confidence_1.000_Length_444::g.117319::m.117319